MPVMGRTLCYLANICVCMRSIRTGELASPKEVSRWEQTLRVKTGRSLCSHTGKMRLECEDAKVSRHTWNSPIAHTSTQSSLQSRPQGRRGWGPPLITVLNQTHSHSCGTSQDFPATGQQRHLPDCLEKREKGENGDVNHFTGRNRHVPGLLASSFQNSKTMQWKPKIANISEGCIWFLPFLKATSKYWNGPSYSSWNRMYATHIQMQSQAENWKQCPVVCSCPTSASQTQWDAVPRSTVQETPPIS